MPLVVTLYIILVAISVFGPLRWAVIAYLLLCTIDFQGSRTGVGLLNAGKAVALPLYLLWRLRAYSGHKTIVVAPIAWSLLIVYAGVAGFWSLFPISALKLIGHMIGMLLICFVFVRATKGGYLSAKSLLPLTVGALVLAALRLLFEPRWADEAARFTSFTTAQGFAAFLAALFCFALCSRAIGTNVRVVVCASLVAALIFDGSRIWFLGVVMSALLAIAISSMRLALKIFGFGFLTIVLVLLVWNRNTIVDTLSRDAGSNRISLAIVALYEGDTDSAGLGTLRFRHGIDQAGIERIENSSFMELVFGRGTTNASVITGSLYRSYSNFADPNRMVHDDWLRIMYEWGLVGFILWCVFIGSIALYAYEGVRLDRNAHAKPLLVYLPAFLFAFAGENFLAGAGSAATNGLLLLIAFATISHRYPRGWPSGDLGSAAALRGGIPAELLSGRAR